MKLFCGVGVECTVHPLTRIHSVSALGVDAQGAVASSCEQEMELEAVRTQKSPDTPGSPEGNTEGPGTASSEPLLPS